MKRFQLLLLGLVLLNTGCLQKNESTKNKSSMMLMDSIYMKDKNVMLVHAKDTLRLIESMKNFEDNPNITKTDIDVANKVKSKEIHYVKPRDTLRIAEPK